MFDQIQERFGVIIRRLRGLGKITDANISEAAREIRRALLQADVNFRVARDFVDRLTEHAQGSPVMKSISPGQQFVKIIHEEMTRLLGSRIEPIRYSEKPPTVIVMAGLQGSGKTTTVAKLAMRIKEEGRKPYLVAADVYRPAAVNQLKTLSQQIGVRVWSEKGSDPVKICLNGIDRAVSAGHDVVILDTAGRLHVDDEMMEELIEISETTNPHEILFVVDGMSGQDAVNSAAAFKESLNLTGTILTKLDGDARGGVALSITEVTGTPVKFIGTGERLDALEPFYPDRMASRILGMGDVITLVEKAEKAVAEKGNREAEKRLESGAFDLEDFREQLRQVQSLGSVEELVSMIPGVKRLNRGINMDERRLMWAGAIINSMTPQERRNPSLIDGSRRRRIAMGSGRSVQEVNTLLKEFSQLKGMVKNLSKSRLKNRTGTLR